MRIHIEKYICSGIYPFQCSFWAPSQVSSDPPAQLGPIVGPLKCVAAQSLGAHPLAAAVVATAVTAIQGERSSS